MANISSDAKKVLSGLPPEAQDYILASDHGSKLTSGEARRAYSEWQSIQAEKAKKAKALEARTPDFLKNDPAFQNLPVDLKEVAVYQYEIQKADNQQKAQAWEQALEAARSQSDPYFANIIRIAQTEIQNGFAELQGDYAVQNENLKRQIQYIQEDLVRNKQNLTLDQQAELGSLAADLQDRQKIFELNMQNLGAQKAAQLDRMELDYRKNVDDISRDTTLTQEEKQSQLEQINRNFTSQRGQIIGAAADAGLTFSTKRKIAEQRLAEDTRGLVESTQRQFNAQLAQLAANRQYIEQQYQQQTGNVQQQYELASEGERIAKETADRKIQEERDRIQRTYSQRIAELETQAARGDTQARAEMEDLQRRLSQSIQSAGLAAEKYLGSNQVSNLPGYNPLGGVAGQIVEDQAQDVHQRRSAIYNELTANSLPI